MEQRGGAHDGRLVQVEPMMSRVDDWGAYLARDVAEAESTALRRHERTGRPLGDQGFIERLESRLGRFLRKRRSGPKTAGGGN